MKKYFSVVLCLWFTDNYDGNASTVGRIVCSDPDESFAYYDINHVVVVT